MNNKLESKLQEDFPFLRRNQDEKSDTPYDRWGIECNDGWFELLYEMCKLIVDRFAEEEISIENIDWKPVQIKEKFSSLRIYYEYSDAPCGIAAIDGLDDGISIRFIPNSLNSDEKAIRLRRDIDRIIKDAEDASRTICEYCGNKTTAKARLEMSWKKTLCDKCFDEFEEYDRKYNRLKKVNNVESSERKKKLSDYLD